MQHLDFDRYRDVIRAESDRLVSVADGIGDAPVPSCPGWDVSDLLRHVAGVFRHKRLTLQRSAPPDRSAEQMERASQDPLTDLGLATTELLDELDGRDPTGRGWTWSSADQSDGFWFRRMAHEVVVHRIDAELARYQASDDDLTTEVDTDVALDGIDEFVTVFVGGSWAGRGLTTAHPVDGSVRLTSDGRSWTVRVDVDRIDVVDGAEGEVDAEVAGSAGELLAWVWGRVPVHAVSVSGDEEIVGELRARFAELS